MDVYDLIDSPHFPGWADRLRQLGVLDNLDEHDARQVAGLIITDAVRVGPHGWADGINEPRAVRNSLQQRAANVGAGCDIRPWCVHPWHDRAAVSNALGIAAQALGK